MTASIHHYRPRGEHGPRHGHWVLLAIFWSTMAMLCVAATVVAIVRAPDTPALSCPPPKLCTGPTPVIPASPVATWTARGGVSLQYPTAVFAVDHRDATTLQLHVTASRPSGVEGTLRVTLHPSSDGAPEALLRARKSDLSTSILGLTEDQDSTTVIPPPRIGGIQGIGGSYRGTLDTPQGPTGLAVAIIGVATDGRSTTVVSYVVTGTTDVTVISRLRAYLSPVLTRFTWTAP